MWSNFGQQIYDNLVANQRYLLYLDGLKATLLMTLGAAVLGVLLGSLIAICKVYARQNRKLRPLEVLCDIYLTVVRGTPMTVQLLLFCFVILTVSMNRMIYVATLAFGINSGAYVAEIVRAGIQAVSAGQTEAGRSLGLTNNMTMWYVVMPQAVKNILPALANEAIVLLKETAIAGYVAVADITYAANQIRSRTYSAVPLLFIALVYLVIVSLMTFGLRTLERRMGRNDSRS